MALLKNATEHGVTQYIDADFNYPERILDHARDVLDFTQPVAVMFMGVLGHVQDYQDSRQIVATVMDAVPSGSYLALDCAATDDEGLVKLCTEYAKTGAVPCIPRPRDETHAYFDGLEMVAPGFVSTTHWRPDTDDETNTISSYCGVAKKP